jgi:integrase
LKLHLTDLSVKALKGSDNYVAYMDTATRGFGIRVGLHRKSWIVIRGEKRERITIGQYPDLSLSEARAEAKRLLAAAPEPKAISKTFKDARDEFLASYPGTRWKLNLTLLLRKFKPIEHLQLAEINDGNVSKILAKLEATPSAQLHAYRAIRTFLRWCTRPPRRYIPHSPMEGYEPPSKDRKGTRVLSDDELVAVWNATETGSRAVFRLMILWGTRNAETCLIERKWAAQEVLTIPGVHTKNGRDHSIPLLPLARSILDGRPNDGPYFFSGRYSAQSHLSPGSLNRMRAEIQSETGTKDWQARDIRRTFRSNMARLKVPREICEVLINHAPSVLDEIYDRYDRVEEKREALAKYEAFMLGLLAQGKT